MAITKDFTVSVYIVYKQQILLHLHKKLNLWLPLGGHINNNELPQEAVIRETKEESGLKIEIYNPDPKINFGDCKQLIKPIHLILENITPNHQHIDMVYFAKAQTNKCKPQKGESQTLRWFTLREIKNLTNTPKNAIIDSILALKALK